MVGRPGTGKTHAVREAVNGAAWINLRDDEFQFDQFFTDLAAQLPAGSRIVDALGAHDHPAVLERAAAELDGVTLVVDRAERLRFDEVWGWDEPVDALWRPAQVVLARWIADQTSHRRVVVIGRGRRGFFAEQARVPHQIPTDWPVKLVHSSHGFRDWAALGNALGGAPAGLWIGALLLELTTKDEFNELVQSFDPVEDPPDQVVRDLLGALRDRLPDDWRRVFATVQALDGAPAEIVETVLKPEERSTLSYLEGLAAIERRRGRLSLMSALTLGEPIATLWPLEHREILGAAAKEYLERVPDVTRPNGSSAELIVRAHGIYVELGDFENARRTARFHVGGLVQIARRESRNGRVSEARRLYESIEPLAGHDSRLSSYIVHYGRMNGLWAGELSRDAAIDGLRRARDLWPENALWWQREAEILLEMGRSVDAVDLIGRAYGSVPEHPRRNLFLRVRPAAHAMLGEVGAPTAALRIIAPLEANPPDDDPDATRHLRAIEDQWREGVPLSELGEAAPHHLVFHAPVVVSLVRIAQDDVRAESVPLQRAARSATALGALARLAQVVAEELRGMIQTPSHRLSDGEVHRKGVLLSLVDALNSDIGLTHRTERWLVGRIEGARFVPVQVHLPPIDLAAEGATPIAAPDTLYFARFRARRDGSPEGPPLAWELAGSGRSLEELWGAFLSLSAGNHA